GGWLSMSATLPEQGHRVHVHRPFRSDIDAIEHRRRPIAAEHELRAIAARAFRRERRRRAEHLGIFGRGGAQLRGELGRAAFDRRFLRGRGLQEDETAERWVAEMTARAELALGEGLVVV